MSPALQQLQDDATSNPGLLFVQAGEALWKQPAGAANKSCADCHGGVETGMKGVAARYPAIPKGADAPVDLEGRINLCRTGQQRAEALKPESQDLLALSAYVTYASRGLAIAPPGDPRLAPFRAEGEALFKGREGQLNLSCANCHDDNAGRGALLQREGSAALGRIGRFLCCVRREIRRAVSLPQNPARP